MPMMQQLLAALQENPPGDEGDLRQILQDTGYDLIPTESGEEMPPEGEEPSGEEEAPEGEEGEVASVTVLEEGPAEEAPPSPLDAVRDMMGGEPPKTQGMKMRFLRDTAADNALRKGKKGR